MSLVAKNLRQPLPLENWPRADREAWHAACRPSIRLRRGGAAGHLQTVTREDHERHYGQFLGFLQWRGILRMDGPAAAHVTRQNIAAYVSELKRTVSSVTVHGAVCKVRRAAKYMVPQLDLGWLAEIGKDLALEVRPKSKFDRVVLAEVLVRAGLTLIQEAELAKHKSQITRAAQVRNGLMVALLALCPSRRKNFAALEIGRTFKKVRADWWIILPGAETKSGRSEERKVDDLLTPAIDLYINRYRPTLARGDADSAALWLSVRTGRPITAKEVANVIRATTLSTVGIAIGPHLFRTCAATTAATYAGDRPHLAAALLDHTDPRTTNTHYNRASSLSAAERFRSIIRQYESANRDT